MHATSQACRRFSLIDGGPQAGQLLPDRLVTDTICPLTYTRLPLFDLAQAAAKLARPLELAFEFLSSQVSLHGFQFGDNEVERLLDIFGVREANVMPDRVGALSQAGRVAEARGRKFGGNEIGARALTDKA